MSSQLPTPESKIFAIPSTLHKIPMQGYSALFISSFYVSSMKNNFGTMGLPEAGKAKAWKSKISTWNVLTVFSTILSNSTCGQY